MKRALVLGLGAGVLAWPHMLRAEPRPTEEGGLWQFDPSDVVELWDEPGGRVRVHYSVEGPNAVSLADLDADGTPDFPQRVAEVAVRALELYAERGFRAPLPELLFGPEQGGSEAIDVYLIDFAGSSDGHFGSDACTPGPEQCAGFLVVENDFVGYDYPSLAAAVDTVVPHELFHAVQAAYGALPIWMSEGTAVWAERLYDPDSIDFLRQCNRYLADPGRSIDSPPPGPIPPFAYGAALWWDFLTARHDHELIVELLEAIEAAYVTAPFDPASVMADVLVARGDPLEESWPVFARWNLATGFRAGGAETHPYASELDAIAAAREGEAFDFNARVFPLATSYWRLDHAGGVLWAFTEPDVHYSLHAVVDAAEDGVVGDALATWQGSDEAIALVDGAELPAGGYWIVAAFGAVAEASQQGRVCLGPEDGVRACAPEETGQTTSPETETETGATGEDSSSTSAQLEDDGSQGGCRCSGTGRHAFDPAWLVLTAVCAVAPLRRGSRSRPPPRACRVAHP